ncbi:Transposase, IS30 family [Piscirickettsia salmonis]|nr:DDE-type integrase/transposase/recombinase [Piscirickettsia salmonis]QGO67204.1 Transposase, IS30 family [Piscirickettsia salmonis]
MSNFIRPEHFEIDTVVGRDHQSYLLTLVDKVNKMCCIRKMPNKQAKTVINTFMNVVGSTFFDFKTITSDNGTEFAGHEAISKITEADFYRKRRYLGRYFAHPMMQNRRAKRDDYKPSAVRVTQRYVP